MKDSILQVNFFKKNQNKKELVNNPYELLLKKKFKKQPYKLN